MAKLEIERMGGFAGFGGAAARLRSRGEVNTDDLSKKDQQVVDNLFKAQSGKEDSRSADTFTYRLSRTTDGGVETVDVAEGKIPVALIRSVKDELL